MLVSAMRVKWHTQKQYIHQMCSLFIFRVSLAMSIYSMQKTNAAKLSHYRLHTAQSIHYFFLYLLL